MTPFNVPITKPNAHKRMDARFIQIIETSQSMIKLSEVKSYWHKWCISLLPIVACVVFVGWQDVAFANETNQPTFCKYSVRDVAFVNIENSNWRLLIQEPADQDESVKKSLDMELNEQLEHVNLTHQWVKPGSDWFRGSEPVGGGNYHVGLVDSNDNMIMSERIDPSSLQQLLQRIINSPKREEILEKTVNSLCVYVLVESGDRRLDKTAHDLVTEAIAETTAQLWSLEKPTQDGPALVTIGYSDRETESWLIKMLGIELSDKPMVCLVYGQGRRMGDVLTGDTLQKKNLVWMAGVCGRDCECSLDREWLYGRQFVHHWDKTKERAVEEVLGFDPRSALVVAEVAQILQKTARERGQTMPDMNDQSSGLVIHDLADVSGSNKSSNDTDEDRSTNIVNEQDRKTIDDDTPSEITDGNSVGKSNARVSPRSEKGEQVNQEANSDQTNADTDQRSNIPWTILIVVAGTSLVVLGWKLAGK